MNEKKKVSMAGVIINCICAIVWNILVVVDLAYGFPNVLHMICALVWDACAVIWILRYLKARKTIDK